MENSWTWAQSRGLVRVNEVHKCEEARLVLEETFEHDLEKGTDREIHAEATLEDSSDIKYKTFFLTLCKNHRTLPNSWTNPCTGRGQCISGRAGAQRACRAGQCTPG